MGEEAFPGAKRVFGANGYIHAVHAGLPLHANPLGGTEPMPVYRVIGNTIEHGSGKIRPLVGVDVGVISGSDLGIIALPGERCIISLPDGTLLIPEESVVCAVELGESNDQYVPTKGMIAE